jgi:hypothetical protein
MDGCLQPRPRPCSRSGMSARDRGSTSRSGRGTRQSFSPSASARTEGQLPRQAATSACDSGTPQPETVALGPDSAGRATSPSVPTVRSSRPSRGTNTRRSGTLPRAGRSPDSTARQTRHLLTRPSRSAPTGTTSQSVASERSCACGTCAHTSSSTSSTRAATARSPSSSRPTAGRSQSRDTSPSRRSGTSRAEPGSARS